MNQGLEPSGVIHERYASEILNFGVGLGLIQRIPSQGPKELNRFSITPAGLAYRAAYNLGLEDFQKFLLTALVVELNGSTIKSATEFNIRQKSGRLALYWAAGIDCIGWPI
jgi:hypothetical protein